eukprot:839531-Rhodomonas_salina.1
MGATLDILRIDFGSVLSFSELGLRIDLGSVLSFSELGRKEWSMIGHGATGQAWGVGSPRNHGT